MHTFRLLESLNSDQLPKRPWRTGKWCRFPKGGILPLAIVVASSVLMVQIFTMSNGQPIPSWKYHWQPSFYLSIFYTAVNISLTYALGQAVTITWWMKALNSDTKLRDLHNIWSFDHGIKEILLSGRAFNFVALAGFFVTLAPINGPLLQHASTITTRSITTINGCS
jgi:hypothetical protein